MKTRLFIAPALLTLALCSPLLAEESNPFRKSPPVEPAAAGSPAGPFISLCEHILVPRKILDAWLDEHPLQGGDASELRKVAATWIAAGTAKLDHTALLSGGAGTTGEIESIVEQIYPTEYTPSVPGEWSRPTSFETRNMGYSFSAGNMQAEKGGAVLTAKISYSTMMEEQTVWDHLAKETKKTGDIFIPRFRNATITQQQVEGADKKDDGKSVDPFGSPPQAKMKDLDLRFEPARTFVFRMSADDQDPAAVVERLVFFRGADCSSAVPAERVPIPESFQLSARIYRVDHRTVSDWLQGRDLGAVPDQIWQAVEEWSKGGKAEVAGSLSGAGRPGLENEIANVTEVIYPTEYECPDPTQLPEGKGIVSHFAMGTSFETRNTGLSMKLELLAGDAEPKLKITLGRTLLLGMSVVHRIQVDGDWKENMTMPVFATNYWTDDLRLNRGKWQLAGIAGDYSKEARQADQGHCVIAFVKVE